jgi:hypothetical protein
MQEKEKDFMGGYFSTDYRFLKFHKDVHSFFSGNGGPTMLPYFSYKKMKANPLHCFILPTEYLNPINRTFCISIITCNGTMIP